MIRVYLAPVRDFGASHRENQSLTADALVLELLGERLHRAENGRPFVSRGFVSISHSGETVALAAAEIPIGIDAEEKRARPEALWERAGASGYADWCKKEAYVKFLGEGFTAHPRTVKLPTGIWTKAWETEEVCLAVCASEKHEVIIKREVAPNVWETALLHR